LSADKIGQLAFANLQKASAVHVSGTLSGIGLDVTMGTATCSGSISEEGTGSFQLLRSGGTVWIKPDDAFWKTSAGSSDASGLKLVEGKYMQTTTSDKSFASFIQMCSPTGLLGQLGTLSGMVKGQATTVGGEPTLRLDDSGDANYFEVSDTAAPRLLRLYAGASQQLTFSAYGVPAKVTPPPAGETLDGATYGF
jgi:hypothetical protein